MATANIILKANHGHVDNAAKKTAREYKKIGNESKTVGDEMGKWGKQAANTLVGVTAIIQVIRRAGQEIARQRTEGMQAAQTRGQALLERGASVRQLGLDKALGGGDRALAALSATSGYADQQKIDSFIGSLAKQENKASPQSIMRGLSLLRTGLFDESEIVKAMESKRDLERLEKQVPERDSRVTFQERFEREKQLRIRQDTARADEIKAARFGDSRLVDARRELQKAQSPIIEGGLEALGLGGIRTAREELGGEMAKELRKIKRDTSRMAENATPRPNYNNDVRGTTL